MRLTEKALAQRKEKILRTAYQLFCELGIDGVTMAQIAKESGVGASAIYRYFDTKAKLLWHTQTFLWRDIVEQIGNDEQESLLSAQNGLEEISVLLYRFKRLYMQHSSYLLFANDYKMYLIRNHIKLPWQDHDWLMEPLWEVFRAALRRGHKDGSISCVDTVEDQFFAVWGLMRGFADQIVLYDKMYAGANPWESRFELAYRCTLEILKNNESEAVLLYR